MLNAEYIADRTPSLGDTYRGDCPECGGKSTFTLSNIEGTAIWNCYKAACKVGGKTRVGVRARDMMKRMETDAPLTAFVLPDNIVRSSPEISVFRRKWNLTNDKLDLRYDVLDNRIVFPVVSNGIIVDAVGRSTWNKSYMKWKRYGNVKLPYTYGSGDTAVIVEDAISAAVVGMHTTLVGLALLGTSVTAECKDYIKNKYSNVIVALDPDARSKAISIRMELTSSLKSTKVLSLQDDLKYMNSHDLNTLKRMSDETQSSSNNIL